MVELGRERRRSRGSLAVAMWDCCASAVLVGFGRAALAEKTVESLFPPPPAVKAAGEEFCFGVGGRGGGVGRGWGRSPLWGWGGEQQDRRASILMGRGMVPSAYGVVMPPVFSLGWGRGGRG